MGNKIFDVDFIADGDEMVDVVSYDLFPTYVTADGTLIVNHPNAETINRVIVSSKGADIKGFEAKGDDDEL